MATPNRRGGARFAGLSSQEVDRLLALGDGDAAIAYMYARRQGLSWPETVPGMSVPRLRAALRRLGESGLLLNPDSENTAGERPEAMPPEAALTRPAFTMVLEEAERLLGRTLSPSDMKLLYDIFDWRGLPPGVILLLLHYCVDDTRRRLGEDARPPGIRQIDREAAIWQNEGLRTEEQAESYIRRREQERSLSARSFKALGVFGRPPSESEKKYVQSWIEMGFEPDAIAIAYDITVLKTGKLTWKYCDTILRRWHAEGLHKRPEIEAREQKKPAVGSAPKPLAQTGLAQTRRALERVKAQAEQKGSTP